MVQADSGRVYPGDEEEPLLNTTLPPQPDADEAALILVVDDDRVGSRHVGVMLEGLGHQALVVNTWTEALQRFTTLPIDLVLMDAVMPTVDGFKLTRIFRERAKSYVPIVFLTGLADQEARRRGIEAGADDLLTKPVDELELRVRLTAMLRIRRLTKHLEEHSRRLSRLARFDALTGLRNRRALDDRLVYEVSRAQRYQRPMSLLVLDVDHFKKVNDSHGHEVGDEVLQYLGEFLRDAVRATDQAYRFGGEEFVVVAVETPTDAAVQLAERIREDFAQQSGDATRAGPQTMSIGVAGIESVPNTAPASALMHAADQALYEAKNNGRNRVVLKASSTSGRTFDAAG